MTSETTGNLQLRHEHSIGLIIAATHIIYQRRQILVGSFQIAIASYAWGYFCPINDSSDSLRKKIYPFVCGSLLGGIMSIFPGIGQLLLQRRKLFVRFWEKSGLTTGTISITLKAMDILAKPPPSKDEELSSTDPHSPKTPQNLPRSPSAEFANQIYSLSPVQIKRPPDRSSEPPKAKKKLVFEKDQ